MRYLIAFIILLLFPLALFSVTITEKTAATINEYTEINEELCRDEQVERCDSLIRPNVFSDVKTPNKKSLLNCIGSLNKEALNVRTCSKLHIRLKILRI